MGKDLITYWLQNEQRETGPYVASILSGLVKGVEVTDDDVKEYVRKMHGMEPVRIERRNVIDGEEKDV